ncbi:hypothetical protein QUW44_00450 [Limosilactobacillus pontis]|uniref:Uncharacterized protein n=1 Tax=Limosilactobacillus pontis TaxID=35787 RepID=A0ABT7UVA8_9LACO|nr:hypothetical protein [Limosilactobacillus pontis]MDM8265645.1 hypothetical protein [Limosilactobacillus pontis]
MINVPASPEVSFMVKSDPKVTKDFIALLSGYKRISPIKRTRKCQIERAKFMNHTGYEWSQYWHKTARKPKGWK